MNPNRNNPISGRFAQILKLYSTKKMAKRFQTGKREFTYIYISLFVGLGVFLDAKAKYNPKSSHELR